jgi:hypothetical protein
VGEDGGLIAGSGAARSPVGGRRGPVLPAKTSIAIGQPSRATEQPIDDLPFAALAVAGVAELGERAAAAFQVAQTE